MELLWKNYFKCSNIPLIHTLMLQPYRPHYYHPVLQQAIEILFAISEVESPRPVISNLKNEVLKFYDSSQSFNYVDCAVRK